MVTLLISTKIAMIGVGGLFHVSRRLRRSSLMGSGISSLRLMIRAVSQAAHNCVLRGGGASLRGCEGTMRACQAAIRRVGNLILDRRRARDLAGASTFVRRCVRAATGLVEVISSNGMTLTVRA